MFFTAERNKFKAYKILNVEWRTLHKMFEVKNQPTVVIIVGCVCIHTGFFFFFNHMP